MGHSSNAEWRYSATISKRKAIFGSLGAMRTGVRIPVGTPGKCPAHLVDDQGISVSGDIAPQLPKQGRAYLIYARKTENGGKEGEKSRPAAQSTLTPYVPLRSSPANLVQIPNESGRARFRVTVSIQGKQRKFVTCDKEEAEEKQAQWEMERTLGSSAPRSKATYLTLSQLREAESAFTLLSDTGLSLRAAVREIIAAHVVLKGAGFSLAEAIRHAVANPPPKRTEVKLVDGIEQFRSARDGHVSSSQLDNLYRRSRMLAQFLGAEVKIADVTTEDVTRWLTDRDVDKGTWNGYRGDVHAVFEWFTLKPRKWIGENPVADVVRYSKRMITRQPPKRMEIANCRATMAWLQKEAPEWCTMIALAMFAGIRPYLRGGEIHKLAAAVGSEGLETYLREEYLHVSAAIAKDRRARSTRIQPNLAAWLKKYPPTSQSICPGDYDELRPIRERFEIGHDFLRHTCISAFVAKFGSIALAATEFGTSETVIRTHYLNRMSVAEAEEFYAIFPL